MSAAGHAFTMPRRVVVGLIEGEAMVNNSPESRDMQAVGVLKAAEYRKAGKGVTAVLTTEPEMMTHIADYLDSLLDQGPGLVFDRFGFFESDARKAISQIERQLKE